MGGGARQGVGPLMFIVYLCKNRGLNGLFDTIKMDWAKDVTIDKEWCDQEHTYSDGTKTTMKKQLKTTITCYQEGLELETIAPKHIVSSVHDGHWEHYYIKDSRTGTIVFAKGR